MKTNNISSWLFFLILGFASCHQEVVEHVGEWSKNIVPTLSFYDPNFDPYTDSPMKDLANSSFVEDGIKGLSFLSEYFSGD
jgi:hypothetical protein